jgi:hypothetical protein
MSVRTRFGRVGTIGIFLMLFTSPVLLAEDLIVATAHQDWLSRIYVLHMDGLVKDYFEYSFYYFADVEVVNNEVYVAEAFAPRVYKVDLSTGDLNVVIDDWSLYVFYDVAFDGTYFYVDEWDLNRYDINGSWQGTVSFDEYVMGSAWDGTYYWTLNDENLIKCWDISAWPTVIEVVANSFTPPSPQCRGLWFDGQDFWSAESIDGILGYIYQFDYNGKVINNWLEPAFRGWAACVVTVNRPPESPSDPEPQDGSVDVPVDAALSWSCTDLDGDTLTYDVYFGDTNPPPLVGSHQPDTLYDPPGNTEYDTRHYWQIIAFDTYTDSSAGPVWSFDTKPEWICGDVDGNGSNANIADLTYLVDYLFRNGPPPPVMEAANVDGANGVNISDLTYLVDYLFRGGPAPVCS